MNYFDVKIKSKNLTAPAAAEIFNRLSTSCKIRMFSYDAGHLFYNTRGLIDVSDILTANNITNEELRVIDEFGAVYDGFSDNVIEVEPEPKVEEEA